MEQRQGIIDAFLTQGILPSNAESGGFKELWDVMTDEQRQKASDVYYKSVQSNKSQTKKGSKFSK